MRERVPKTTTDPLAVSRMLHMRKRFAFGLIALALLIGAIAGWIAPRSSEPLVLDDPFWREFWTGPPAAGLFALIGAVVAFLAAAFAARSSRASAARKEWWDRAEWALGNVMEPGEKRDIGLAAVEVVMKDATPQEAALLDTVTSFLLPNAPEDEVDTHGHTSAE